MKCKHGMEEHPDWYQPHWERCGSCGRELLERLDSMVQKWERFEPQDPMPITENLYNKLKELGVPEVTEGTKETHDAAMAASASKEMVTLIPPTAIRQEARAMENGYAKYGRASWRKMHAVSSHSMADKVIRHILDWLEGEERAEDSGVHHLAHARADLGIMLDALEAGFINDDRIK